jgi:hypothetical protein
MKNVKEIIRSEGKKSLTSASLCVAERFPGIALLPPFVLTVLESFSLLVLVAVPLVGFVSAIVAPFFAALSSFFGALAASFASVY